MKSFHEIIEKCQNIEPMKVCVAAAEDQEVVDALAAAQEMGICEPVFVGDSAKIEAMVKGRQAQIVHADDPKEAVATAVQLVRDGQADVLMKGLVNTSDFMRGVLNRDSGLRTDRLISHMACYEIPGHDRLVFVTDSGINVAPDLMQKKDILTNALTAIRGLGYQNPNVALLAANEQVNEKVPATYDAKQLVDMWDEGAFGICMMEGPMALDVIFSREAADHKGIESKVSGKADLLHSPYIEVGNALGKSWLHFNQAKWAGLVLGAQKPIILGSRSDTAEIKINAIAMAALYASTLR